MTISEKLHSIDELEQRDQFGYTALLYAANQQYLDLVDQLISKQVKVNVSDHYGRTSLMYACFNGQSDMVQRLLQADADPNIKDRMQWSALTYAADMGYEHIFCILLDSHADLNSLFVPGFSYTFYKNSWLHTYVTDRTGELTDENLKKWKVCRLQSLFQKKGDMYE